MEVFCPFPVYDNLYPGAKADNTLEYLWSPHALDYKIPSTGRQVWIRASVMCRETNERISSPYNKANIEETSVSLFPLLCIPITVPFQLLFSEKSMLEIYHRSFLVFALFDPLAVNSFLVFGFNFFFSNIQTGSVRSNNSLSRRIGTIFQYFGTYNTCTHSTLKIFQEQ